MRSLIDIQELTIEEIDELIAVANDIIDNPSKYSEKCKGKILATLFSLSHLQEHDLVLNLQCLI